APGLPGGPPDPPDPEEDKLRNFDRLVTAGLKGDADFYREWQNQKPFRERNAASSETKPPSE
ncbi:MAG: hypothetical protein ACREH9_05450, partial [Pseudomonadota bacterium]